MYIVYILYTCATSTMGEFKGNKIDLSICALPYKMKTYHFQIKSFKHITAYVKYHFNIAST